MINRIALKTIEFTAACLAVSFLFVAAETTMMIIAGEFSHDRI
jgi:hypothetical protein